MKGILAIILVVQIGCIACKSCTPTQAECENLTSEYTKYRECMEHRIKRSADCYQEKDDCEDCDCDECSSCQSCKSSCCSNCCQSSNTCNSYSCCYKTCRAECRSSSCRTSCKKQCQAPSKAETINLSMSQPIIPGQHASDHNITTIIHLNNVINNTNLINLPINVNSTNVNNITVLGSDKGSSQQGCCSVIGPRQCERQEKFPFVRCFHLRKRVCSDVCTSPVVHYQQHQICENNQQQSCHNQGFYVPQPQPSCAHSTQWPYVNCGNRNLHSCEGCYDHYINRGNLQRCSSFCYDDGYGTGPYYRQGPFYRPGYSHVPSCYQTGFCGGGSWPSSSGGYSGYGGGESWPSSSGGDYLPSGGGYLPSGGSYPPYGGSYPPSGGSNWGLGYPPLSYGSDQILDNDTNTSVPIQWQKSLKETIINPYYPFLPQFDPLPPGIIIEPSVHSDRYAEIKIVPYKETGEEEGEESTSTTEFVTDTNI